MTEPDETESKPSSDPISRTLTIISSTLLFAMMALTFTDVIGRYFLRSPITGVHEIIALLLGLTIFTAFPLVTKDRTHITVGLFESHFKGRVRYVLRLIVLLGTLGIVGFLTFLMFDQAESMRESRFLTEYLDVPLAPVVYVLSALSLLALLIFLVTIWGYIRRGGDFVEQSNPQEPPA